MQQSPATNGVPGTATQPAVPSQALQRGAQAFLDMLKTDSVIRQFVLKNSQTRDSAAQTAVEDGSDTSESALRIAALQQELSILKEELKTTKEELAEAKRMLAERSSPH